MDARRAVPMAFAIPALGLLGACSDDAPSHLTPSDAGSRMEAGPDRPDAEPEAAVADVGVPPEARAESGTTESGPPDSGPPVCAVPASPADVASRLSETGCVVAADPKTPSPALIPYTVISPLWSDGAEKHRYVVVPPGETIVVKDCADPSECRPLPEGGTPEDEGHWELPVGTVLMKTFVLDGRFIETRLLMRFNESTWRGFSYEWDADETDATLVPDGKDRDLGDQVWHYPSPAQCLQCHTSAAGRTLGLNSRQLDVAFDAGDGPMNQIDRFESLGLLSTDPPRLGAYPDPMDTDVASLEDRARAYLAVNCSICHRPGGALDDVDLRYTTPFGETRLCNEPIARGTGDVALPQIRLTPTSPADSSLSFRMHDRGPYRMPATGSNVVDPAGTALIDDWIRSIAACP